MGETYRFYKTSSSSEISAADNAGLIYMSSSYMRLAKTDADGKPVTAPQGIWIAEVMSHAINWFQTDYSTTSTNYIQIKCWTQGTSVSTGQEVVVKIEERPDMDFFTLKSSASTPSKQGMSRRNSGDLLELNPSNASGVKLDNFAVGDIVRFTTPYETYEIQVTDDGDLSELFDEATPNYRHIFSEQHPKSGEIDNKILFAPFKMEKVGSVLEGGGEATNLLKVGDTPISTAFVADTAVSKIYAGNTLVFGAGEGGGSFTPDYEVVAQDEGSWIDGTFTKVFDVTNTGDIDLFVEGGLRAASKIAPNETIQATYTSIEEGRADTLYLEFRLESGFLFKIWEEKIITPPLTWTAGVYPTKEGEFRFYRITGGMIYITFANVPDPGWTEGADYQINHSKLGDLGTNTLLDIQLSGDDVRLGFLDNGSWGTEGNGIFEVGTTMTLAKSPLLISEEFGYNSSSTPAVGNLYPHTSYVRLNPADGARWKEAMTMGCDAIVSINGQEASYTRRYFDFWKITTFTNYWDFYFQSSEGKHSTSTNYRYTFSAYESGRLPE